MEEVLENLGLTKVESKVYLDLLRNGKSFAGEIAKRTRLNRTNLYDVLQSLKQKGFIFTSENVKKVFVANPPEILLKKYEENRIKIKEIVGELKKEIKPINEKTNIRVFEGKRSFDEILKIILEEKSPIYFYGVSTKSSKNFGEEYIKQIHSERIKNKIPMKILSFKYPKERLDNAKKIPYTEIKNISDKYFYEDNVTMFVISGNKVVIGTQVEPIYLFMIENEKIAKNYTSFFNMLWNVE
jgi:sugar-specific transcriptional regulator TrmB